MSLAYVESPIDRAGILRADDAAVRALLTGGAARIVPVWKQRHLIAEDRAVDLNYGQAAPLLADGALLAFLGLAGEVPWFALGLPESESPPALDVAGEYRALNDVVLVLPRDQASTLAYARAMVIWHETHRFCGRCGAPTLATENGHSRTCTRCGNRTFPRTDPVVITLIADGERCLLGRQAVWPAGMYSAIAGFVEPGETLEAAVRREALEETGIAVGAVRYMASQPWPFPASLMLGFRAEALTNEIHRKDNELEDCRWFTRAEIRGFHERTSSEPGFKLPHRFAIARFLLESWLAE